MAEQNLPIKILGNREKDYHYDEAIKTLRTNIDFSGSNLKVIMLTSTLMHEGKSETTMQLAISMAQAGKKILFIDGDIRKSVLAAGLKLKHSTAGLTQFLTGQKHLGEILIRTEIPNLDLILCGPVAPNPAELLSEEAFDRLIRWAREEYDMVIIDTPPVGEVIDASIIARHCDGAILLIESGSLSYRLVQRTKKQLERTGCRILGAVLNRVDMSGGGYYNKYYGKYYAAYGHYYQSEAEA